MKHRKLTRSQKSILIRLAESRRIPRNANEHEIQALRKMGLLDNYRYLTEAGKIRAQALIERIN